MEEKNYKWKTRGSLWATIPIFIVLLMLPAYGVFAIERAQEGIRLEAINIVVEATLTDIMPIGGGGSSESDSFNFYYTYVAEDGTVYKGYTIRLTITGTVEAYKMIEEGYKISIYIDDKGNSIPVSDVQGIWVTITTTSVSAAICLIFFIVFLVPRKVPLEKIKRKKKNLNVIKDA